MICDVVKYPVFLHERGPYMYVLNSEKELGGLEAIDVEGGEYCGWDNDGRPVELGIKDGDEICIGLKSIESDTRAVRDAIMGYAGMLSRGRVFTPSRDNLTLLELFNEAEQFRYEGSILWKVVRFFRRRPVGK